MLAGSLSMARVPSKFYIQASGFAQGHDINPRMANLSHQVNHLAFRKVGGHPIKEVVPKDFDQHIAPFDGNVYVIHQLHEAFHHHIKLVSTSSEYYHVLENSQISYYRQDQVPEAKFVLDISPIAVRYRWWHRPWYDYVTSILAIVGGTFTVVGMVEAIIRLTSRQVKRQKQSKPHMHPN
jgi:hypothetical protein